MRSMIMSFIVWLCVYLCAPRGMIGSSCHGTQSRPGHSDSMSHDAVVLH